MAKSLSFIFIILSLIFFTVALQDKVYAIDVDGLNSCASESADETAACNGACAVNGDGAIIIHANGMPADADNTSSYRDNCNMIPDNYKVNVYYGGLCTADPYSATGDTVDYTTNCDLFFTSPDVSTTGTPINLVDNGDGTASADSELVSGGINLGIKTYTHAFMILSNHLQIKHTQTYDFSLAAASGMAGGGATLSSGTTCWTIAAVSTYSNLDGTGHGETLRTGSPEDPAEISTKCGATVDTSGDYKLDYATEIIETFGDADGNWGSDAVVNRGPYVAASRGLDIGGTKAVILLQSNNVDLATTMENGERIFYIVAMTNPLVITENTTTFNIGFGLTNSVSVDFAEGAAGALTNVKHGADPIDIRFTAN